MSASSEFAPSLRLPEKAGAALTLGLAPGSAMAFTRRGRTERLGAEQTPPLTGAEQTPTPTGVAQ